jgi:alpha-ketoglutarate-dependent taurine dioxygenase
VLTRGDPSAIICAEDVALYAGVLRGEVSAVLSCLETEGLVAHRSYRRCACGILNVVPADDQLVCSMCSALDDGSWQATAGFQLTEEGLVSIELDRSRKMFELPDARRVRATRDEVDLEKISPWVELDADEVLVACNAFGDQETARALRHLERYGICQIRIAASAPTVARLREIANHFGGACMLQNDFFGDVKGLEPSPEEEATSGDSSKELGPHVDGTQNKVQPAILGFQYDAPPEWGARSTFWDAAHFYLELTDAERALMAQALSEPHAGVMEKKGLRFEGPLLTITNQGTLALRVRFDKVLKADPACREPLTYLQACVGQRGLELTPQRGDIIIFDNRRILHGRREVGGTLQRTHHRIWIKELHRELLPKYRLGIRPVDPEIVVELRKRGAVLGTE